MTTVPVLAIFIIAIETEFFERYQAFYRAIEAHATWREIRENHAGIIRSLNAAGRNILLLQSVIAALAILCSPALRSEEHTSELQSLMRISYAVFCLKKNTTLEKYHTQKYMDMWKAESMIKHKRIKSE